MSQGATRKKMQHILLMEAGLYAVIGALFGVVL
jgi:putative ABC transport system permease protein